jgi:hypothetical protein
MNDGSLIKAGIEQLMRPIQELLDKLLGPAATAVGDSLGDSAKVWRFKRQLRHLKEIKRMIDASDKDIKPVATRLFFPVLQAASIEDDDDMQSRWAALIANEAIDVGTVHPSFIEILRQLAPQDARLLDSIYDHCIAMRTKTAKPWVGSVTMAERDKRRQAGENPEESFTTLVRLGLVQPTYKLTDGKKQLKIVGGQAQVFKDQKLKGEYELSDVAFKFVAACRAPKPKLGSK